MEMNILKKSIKYRLSYSGTKETDIIYKNIISKKLDFLSEEELLLLSTLFNEISDIEIFNWITKKKPSLRKYKNLIDSISNE
jgi:succinate dehydrogenase flavin-adding protein (antitoxin of CptAB toxin-antitoxin module)